MITRRDEYFHERSDDPHWNESGWFSFMVPERRLSGMVYCYHRPNLGYSTGGFAAWDPSGDRHDYDQIGRMTGRLSVDGETIDVDGWSMRDHSLGSRKIAKDQRGRFVWAIASEDDAFFVWASAAQPVETDPVTGVPERVVAGWHLRDGVVAAIVGGESFVYERRPDGAPLADRLRATDELGRELVAEGRATNMLTWPNYPTVYAWFAHFEWEFDGRRASGEEQEWLPINQRRRFVRRLRASGP